MSKKMLFVVITLFILLLPTISVADGSNAMNPAQVEMFKSWEGKSVIILPLWGYMTTPEGKMGKCNALTGFCTVIRGPYVPELLVYFTNIASSFKQE